GGEEVQQLLRAGPGRQGRGRGGVAGEHHLPGAGVLGGQRVVLQQQRRPPAGAVHPVGVAAVARVVHSVRRQDAIATDGGLHPGAEPAVHGHRVGVGDGEREQRRRQRAAVEVQRDQRGERLQADLHRQGVVVVLHPTERIGATEGGGGYA